MSSQSATVTEVASGVYKLELPMPFELKHINAYLIKENNRLALVDCGLNLPDSWEALLQNLAAVGVKPAQLTDIFVTHAHPDHIGQLPRLRALAPEARVFLHRREYNRLHQRETDEIATTHLMQEWFNRNGAPELTPAQLFQSAYEGFAGVQADDYLVEGGERVRLAAEPVSEWEIMWTPGHTAGHFVLVNRERGLLLSGDHLLTSISSNIGKYPGSTDDPVGDFIQSLENIGKLDLQQILPAHGLPFSNYRERIATLIEHHHQRLERIHSVLGNEPCTAAEVADKIWGSKARGFHRYLALFEAVSHLERLQIQGAVTSEDTSNLRLYRAA